MQCTQGYQTAEAGISKTLPPGDLVGYVFRWYVGNGPDKRRVEVTPTDNITSRVPRFCSQPGQIPALSQKILTRVFRRSLSSEREP